MKTSLGFIGSSVVALVGMLLRLNARAIAWPSTYSYSGARADTSWGRLEAAIAEVGLVLLCTGALLFVLTYAHWLFAADKSKTD